MAVETPVLLHLHIPKSAGTSLNLAIEELHSSGEYLLEEEDRLVNKVYYPHAGIDKRYVPDENAIRILNRPDLKAVVGHFSFGLHQCINRKCNYVTLLRDPVDRILSLYYHILKWDHEPELHDEMVNRRMSLHEFVTELNFAEVDNGQTRRIAGVQLPFGKCDRSVLKEAQRNLVEHFAAFGLTERFNESVALITRRLKWPKAPSLSRINVNESRPRYEVLEAETIAAILERNQLDLELYAFAERLFLQQTESEGCSLRTDMAYTSQQKG
jgi:hypothetical protein